jgi:predicted AlkP superfamily pyrophosphatase or phosphodiesterase
MKKIPIFENYPVNEAGKMRSTRFCLDNLVRLITFFMLIAFAFTGFGQNNPVTVVLSVDGFRWDYPERFHTPNLDRIAAGGVKAEHMIPSFPTTTFANHYTLATGLYPDNHGIVLNSFFAPDLDTHYNMRDRSTVEDGRFYGGEPIWVTAETQGVKTATFYWVGSEAAVKGVRPTYYKLYDQSFPYGQRIDTVIYWLSLPQETRPRLIMWYFDEPDGAGHRLGPEGESIGEVVKYLDSLIGVFLDKMETLPHAGEINFIVLSDHGMGQLYPDQHISPDHYIDTAWLIMADGWNPVMNLRVKEGYVDSVVSALEQAKHLSVWRRGEAPEHLHYHSSPRIHDVTLVADPGWALYWSWDVSNVKGTHGYDPAHPDMHAIFYATGPDFKEGHLHPPFRNIHVYPLLARLLGITPARVDGHPDALLEMGR